MKILIVDDHNLFRKGLSMTLGTIDDCEVIGEATNGKELLALLNSQSPDLILTDIQMPVMDGIEMTRKVLADRPYLKIAALSMSDEEKYLHAMVEAGAIGFLLKDIDLDELTIAIHNFKHGQNYFSPKLLPFFTKKYLGKKSEDDIHFSKREMEVLTSIAQGLGNQEIADKHFISIRTVEGHKAKLIAKTGSKNIVNLLIYAIKNNLVQV